MKSSYSTIPRRRFLEASTLLLATPWQTTTGAADPPPPATSPPVIDIHQHTNYAGRTNEQLRAHQRALGITLTVLLPAGRFYGLDAKCGGNQTVVDLAAQHPKEFVYFANEVTDLPDARAEVARFLKAGAIGIGEQKFRVEGDSRAFWQLCELAQEHQVPILMHFQHNTYNTAIERFHRTLEKFPKVNFIGHAQTFWGNIDQDHKQEVLYPKGKVTPGGLTDRLLRDHPNFYGDLSAGSGLNAMERDEEHARSFLDRHQHKLMYGSDCDDAVGAGKPCSGAQMLALVRRLAPHPSALEKILGGNARRVLRLPG